MLPQLRAEAQIAAIEAAALPHMEAAERTSVIRMYQNTIRRSEEEKPTSAVEALTRAGIPIEYVPVEAPAAADGTQRDTKKGQT